LSQYGIYSTDIYINRGTKSTGNTLLRGRPLKATLASTGSI